MGTHIHGGNIYEYGEILDFSANLNPLGIPAPVREAAIRAIDRSDHYPDPEQKELKRAIALAKGLKESRIICGNGAAELIFLVCQALKPKRALLTAPSFAEYEAGLQTVGCEIRFYERKEEQNFSLEEDYLQALTDDIDIAFLCNPNNPSGSLISGAFLRRILAACKAHQILLVLDECFLDFVSEQQNYTMEAFAGEEKLFLLKAFTKSFAIAGLRLGYGVTGNEGLLKEMNRLRQPWNVSVPAQKAGEAAAGMTEFLEETVRYVETQKKLLLDGLRRFPVKVYPAGANFILLRTSVTDFREKMIPLGILVRDCSNYRGLEDRTYYRIAVRTERENQAFLSAMETLFAGEAEQKQK